MSNPPPLPELTTGDLTRYSRHILLPEVGLEGQRRLKAARVLCVGAGGLGSPLAFYLAAAGIGTLGLVDFDVVDLSNLQRQILHSTPDVGRKKLDSAAEKLTALNPALHVVKHDTMLSSQNALEILKDYDIVADGTDNFPTRYLVNDACVLLGKPNVYGSIFRFEGQASVFATPDGPCYRCLYPEPPPPGLVPQLRRGRCPRHSSPASSASSRPPKSSSSSSEKETRSPAACSSSTPSACAFASSSYAGIPSARSAGSTPTVTRLIDYHQFCGLAPQSTSATTQEKTVQNGIPQLTVQQLKQRIDAGEDVYLIDVREPYEYQIANLGGKLIPLNDVPKRLAEIDRDRESRPPLQNGRAQPAGRRVPQAAGLLPRRQPRRRHHRLEQPDRPQGPQVLTCVSELQFKTSGVRHTDGH